MSPHAQTNRKGTACATFLDVVSLAACPNLPGGGNKEQKKSVTEFDFTQAHWNLRYEYHKEVERRSRKSTKQKTRTSNNRT